MGYRMYSSRIGRFLSVDPLHELMPSHSPYHYAFNSPLVWSDPSGLAPEKDKNIHSEKLQGELIKIRILSSPIMPGEECWVYIEDEKDFYFSAEYDAGFADDSHLRSLGGHGGGGVSSGRSLGSTLGFGPKTYDPYNILNPNGNGVNVKAGTRTNPTQNYTKINVHNIEKNMCHLNFDNYPRENDEFFVINRQVTLASNNGVNINQWLTGLQISLDTYGTFDQGLGGMVAGIASGMIDVYRGNYIDAGISLLSAAPVVGIVGDMWKAGRNAEKVVSIARNTENLAKKFKLNAGSKTTKSIIENFDMKAQDFISKYRHGSIKSVFPSEYLDKTIIEVLNSKNSTARKLLIDSRFLK